MRRLPLALKSFCAALCITAAAQSTHAQSLSLTNDVPRTISFQGALTNPDGAPVLDGEYAVTLSLYADPTGSVKLWQDTYNTVVSGGIFNLYLGSGKTPLPDAATMNRPIWIGMGINGEEQISSLTPLASSPYALNVSDKAITTAKLADGAVTADKVEMNYIGGILVNGQQVTARGTLLNLEGSEDIALTYNNQTNTLRLSRPEPGMRGDKEKETTGLAAADAVWSLNGDGWDISSGTSVAPASGDWIGTSSTSGATVEMRTNGETVMRYQPNGTNTPNVVGGYSGNGITTASIGSVIAGGGGSGISNQVTNNAHYAFIGSGVNNEVSANYSAIAGGSNNEIDAEHAAVSGGYNNTVHAQYGAILGGRENEVSYNSDYSGIGSGYMNYNYSTHSFVGSGTINAIWENFSFIGSGTNNVINSILSDADHSVIGGGENNTVSAIHSIIGGGKGNLASANYSAVLGGQSNDVSGTYTTIGGGYDNTASANYSSVLGGQSNDASAIYAAIGGGYDNTASGVYSTIAGGYGHASSGNYGTVGGGYRNSAAGTYATVSGGAYHIGSGLYATISGGAGNWTNADYAAIMGGELNEAVGKYSATLGGNNLKVQSYAQSAAGFNNLPRGSITIPPTPITLPTINDPLFMVGNGTNNTAQRSNAFEVSYNGHSIVYDRNGASTAGGRVPYRGATYTDNVIYAWGTVGAAGGTFGVTNIVAGPPGTTTITISLLDPVTGTPINLNTAAITATLLGPATGGEFGCGTIRVSAFGTPGANQFQVYTYGANCMAQDLPFMFHLTGRP